MEKGEKYFFKEEEEEEEKDIIINKQWNWAYKELTSTGDGQNNYVHA